jgi:hypothetical protein
MKDSHARNGTTEEPGERRKMSFLKNGSTDKPNDAQPKGVVGQ